ncbi:hypothetical protein [Ekhidna sp.]|jgi:glyceraldehyde-3-phosphate dehydrogenase (NAD(P))|uniref:hypothetical protein n=1 Tax=Ekhidna sp. TaxID=2608089 RepID=UPI0032EEA5C0
MQRKIALIGYGVIGNKVADAIVRQDDVLVFGVCDVFSDWRIKTAIKKGLPVYVAPKDTKAKMQQADVSITGTMTDLLDVADLAVDCTPKNIAAQNVETYRERKMKFILQEMKSTEPLATLLIKRKIN